MKRWTAALCSRHLRTLTMTSPAATALTAATASTPRPAPHLRVSFRLDDLAKCNTANRRRTLLINYFSASSTPPISHLNPQTAQAGAGGEAGALRRGDGVLLPPEAGLHQRAQSGGQLPGHGPPPLLHQTLHAGRVRPRAGEQPPPQLTPAPAPGEAQRPQDEGQFDLTRLNHLYCSYLQRNNIKN